MEIMTATRFGDQPHHLRTTEHQGRMTPFYRDGKIWFRVIVDGRVLAPFSMGAQEWDALRSEGDEREWWHSIAELAMLADETSRGEHKVGST